MGFIFRFAGLALVSSMATSVCHSEVLGTFEGRVTGGYERGARAPARMVTGDLVIGCFRYLPEDAEIEFGPARNGIWQYRFSDVPPRSVFAISIGSLVWRSGEIFTISVANDKKLFGDRIPRIGDALIFWYGLHPRYQAVPPLHPGVPPGGLGHAWLIFKAYGPHQNFLRSEQLPDGFEALDFTGVDRKSGTIGAGDGTNHWAVRFQLDPQSIVINGRPALPGAVPPETADEAAGLCSEAVVSDASEATETR